MQLTDLEDFWSQFERDIAWIYDVKVVLTDKVSEDWEKRIRETAALLSSFLVEDICTLFEGWVESFTTDFRNRLANQTKVKKTVLENLDSYFLNFNYSPVLEENYKIKSDQICHIHGSVFNKEFIFGHNYQFDSYDLYRRSHPSEVRDFLYDLVDKTRKSVGEQIQKHHHFFEKLSSVEEIYIIGFGINDENGVDAPYFREIFSKIPNANIFVDSFDVEKEYTIKKILKAWGAKNAYQLQFIDTEKDEIIGGNE